MPRTPQVRIVTGQLIQGLLTTDDLLVTDLGRSVAWYGELLDLVPFREFVEQGVLRGVALRSPRPASPSRSESGSTA